MIVTPGADQRSDIHTEPAAKRVIGVTDPAPFAHNVDGQDSGIELPGQVLRGSGRARHGRERRVMTEDGRAKGEGRFRDGNQFTLVSQGCLA